MPFLLLFLFIMLQSNFSFAQDDSDLIPMAEILKSQGKYLEAIEEYGKWIKAEPYNAECYFRRGKLYHQLNNDSLALKDFNKTISINPNYCDAYAEIYYIYAIKQDKIAALKTYNDMVKNKDCEKDTAKVKAKIFSILQR
jgi:tetratricopeptide (TPR) repeat protein